jgi:methylase of polypeptide subunit release factors
MAPLMALPAELLADLLAVEQDTQLRVLDLATGHGLYGLAIAKRHPHAEITAVDWANVLEVARAREGPPRPGAGQIRTG